MWGLEQGSRLWVCQQPVSMRYGIRGLTQMVWSWKGHSPASGDVYVFFSKNRKAMKALKWDGDGFLMYTKRLSQGRFREVLKKGDDGVRRLQWGRFLYADEGPHACEGDGRESLQNGRKIRLNNLLIK